MKKFLPKGFTLIELLVVISIIGVLSVIGIASYRNVNSQSRDTKRKADIDAIAQVYEQKYDSIANQYKSISTSDFADGKIPQDPNSTKGDYFNWLASDGSGFKICTTLEANPNTVCNTPATNCICTYSSRGKLNTAVSFDPSTNTNTQQLGSLGSSTPAPSCDPNGSLQSNLVGYWKMEETGTGTTLTDSSGSGITLNTGNADPNTQVLTPTPVPFANDIFGKAVNLDGIKQAANIGTTGGSTLNPLTTITISAWIKPTVAQLGLIVSRNGPYALKMLATRVIEFWILAPPNSWTIVNSGSTTVVLNSWSHVLATYDGRSYKLYVNKNLVGSSAFATAANMEQQGRTFWIGYGDCGFCNYFPGLIDDVRVYNRTLTSTEVSYLYNSGNGCIP